MASNEIVKTLTFKVGGEESVKSLRQRIKDLQDALLNVEKGSEDWQKITQQLVDDQGKLNDVLKAGKTQMDVATDSIVGMERQYKALYDTYKLLTEEQRNSDFGKEMAKSLSELHDKLNNTKMEVGNFKDNIGNYTKSAMDAFSKLGISVGALQKPLQLASMGTKELGKSMKALIANPVTATIMAIVVAFKALSAIADKVKESIKGNEESSMKLKEAMAAFQPVIDGVKNAFDKVGQVVVKVIEGFANAFVAIRKLKAGFTDFLGVTKGAKKALEEQVAVYSDIAKSQNELTKTTREYQKLNAEDEAKVQELRERASETNNLTEKEKLLNEAKEAQAVIDQRNIALAEENLRILKKEADLTANDAAANDALAAAEAAVAQARADANRNARQFNKEMNGINNSRAAAAKQAREEVEKLVKKINEETQSEVKTITEKYNKEKALLEKYHKDTKALEAKYQKDIAKIRNTEIAQIRASAMAYREALVNVEELPKALDDTIGNIEGDITDFTNDLVYFFNIWGDTSKIDSIEYLQSLINSLGSSIDFVDAETQKLLPTWEEFNTRNNTEIKNIDDLKTALLGYIKSLDDARKARKTYAAEGDVIKKEIENILNFNNSDLLLNGLFDNDEIDAAREEAYKELGISLIKGKMLYEDYYQNIESLREQDLIAEVEYRKQMWENFSGDENKKLEFEKQYYEAQNALDDYYLDAKIAKLNIEKETVGELQDAYLNLAKSATDSIGSIIDSIASMTDTTIAATQSEIQNGKLTEKQIEKKKKALKTLESIQLAIAIAGIAADTASGIMGVWRGYGMEQAVNAQTAAATGPAAAATFAALQAKSLTMAGINTGIIAAAGTANLAAAISGSVSNFKAINQLGSEGGASGTAAGSTPAIIDATPYSYSRELQTNAEREEEINKPVWVSVVDINNAQNKVNVTEKERTF